LGGLSNRIKCLVSSIRLAEKTKRELILYWPKSSSCNCHFSDLFENDIKEISRENIKNIIKNKKCEVYTENLYNFKGKKEFIINFSTKIIGFSKKNIHLKFENIPKEIRTDISSYIGRLKIKKEILKIAGNFSNKKFTKEIIGIHIRRGDFRTLKSKVGFVSSDEKFIEEIEKEIKLNSKVKFFLATDEKETEEKFKKIFGNRIIFYEKNTKKREEDGSVKEALIELLLLSKCKLILGSFGSTFTEMAWFFGNCRPKVKIVMDKKALREYISLTKERKNIFNSIKQVVYKIITPLHVRLIDRV
jgi:hypothetical protein